MEEVIRDFELQRDKTIFTKSVQILQYAYDLDIIGRSFKALPEAFLDLEYNAKKMGLVFSENKAKL